MKSQQPIRIERLVVGQMATNCFLLTHGKTGDTIIIDPGDDAQYIIEKIEGVQAKPKAIIATHGHFDHIMAAYELEHTYKIPFLIHEKDIFLVKRMKESAEYFLGMIRSDPSPGVSQTFSDKEQVFFGEISLRVIETAGHTPGSVCFQLDGKAILFVGDTVFADGGVGRTDFQYSDPDELALSLKKIFSFGDATVLYPGHGESTSVGKEKVYYAAG